MKLLIKSIILVTICFLILKSCTPFLGGSNPLVGQSAPDFSLQALSGEKVNLTQFRDNQPAVIFFWATWCPHCRTQLNDLSQQRSQIEQKGIKIILVDVDESIQEVQNYISSNNIPFNVLLDYDARISEKYHLIGVPTFFFINREGIIVTVEHYLPENYQEILLGLVS